MVNSQTQVDNTCNRRYVMAKFLCPQSGTQFQRQVSLCWRYMNTLLTHCSPQDKPTVASVVKTARPVHQFYITPQFVTDEHCGQTPGHSIIPCQQNVVCIKKINTNIFDIGNGQADRQTHRWRWYAYTKEWMATFLNVPTSMIGMIILFLIHVQYF